MKVHVTQGDPVPENGGLVVLSPTGDYDHLDLIECGPVGQLGSATVAFQAQFVKFGGVTYREEEFRKVLSDLGVEAKAQTLDELMQAEQSKVVGDLGQAEASKPTAPVCEPEPAPAPAPAPEPQPLPKPKPKPEVIDVTPVAAETVAAEPTTVTQQQLTAGQPPAQPLEVERFSVEHARPEVQAEP